MLHPSVFARLAVVFVLCLLLTGCKSKVTKANYEKVQNGMTLDDVVKLLGKGEKETGDGSNVAGQFGVALPSTPVVGGGDVYVWESDKSTVRITFRQGKVIHKMATGF
ncbi:MAG: hypothetical protein EBV06_07765 [Planctomycetia bacterium]|nr:hypothetical protein [Planctomycetia bacterium]